MIVLLPCAGMYKRFPNGEIPKYLRPLNDMRPMISWAIDSIREFNPTLLFAIRRKDEDEWHVSDILYQYEGIDPGAIQILKEETQGQAHTVAHMLRHFRVETTFLVKDGDCHWRPQEPWPEGNAIPVGWRETAIGDRGTKSWAQVRRDNQNRLHVQWIEEKQTPSDWYCCGGYQFESPERFLNFFDDLYAHTSREIYCSQVIQGMLRIGESFLAVPCEELYDWGDFEKYVFWRRQRRVYFFDLDGVLSTTGGPYGKTLWKEVKPLPGVANKLQFLKEQHSVICIVTSRPPELRATTEQFLASAGIPYDFLFDGIPNGPRVMVNDYSASNPYPSVEAINTKRDSADWVEKLDL